MKIKIPPMQPEDGVAGITLNRIFEARDQQWLELVGPVVEALVNSSEIINQLAVCHDDQSCPAVSVAHEFLADNSTALRAITEEQP